MQISKSAMTITTMAFVGVFGGGIFLFTQAGTIVKGFLEKTATATLGVPVTIDNVVVNLGDKQAAVQGLTIGNATGFDKPYVMKVDQIAAQLGSISKELVVINAIDVQGASVNLEVTQKGSNVSAIQKGIKAKPADDPKPAADTSAAEAEEAAAAVKVIIDRLNISPIAVKPSVSMAGYEVQKDVEVPAIALRDIGRKDNGVLVHEAIAQVSGEVLKKINVAAADAGLSPEALIKSLAGDKFDEVKDKVKGLGEGLKNMF